MLRAIKTHQMQRWNIGAKRSALVVARRSPRHCRLSFADFTFGDTLKFLPKNKLRFLSPKMHQTTECHATQINQRQKCR